MWENGVHVNCIGGNGGNGEGDISGWDGVVRKYVPLLFNLRRLLLLSGNDG